MKQAENNEIDTLLRNLARRERAVQARPDPAASSTAGDLAIKGAHLDVDELSSYAERALPPSARARCTAHLADCDDCRKIVAQLSLAAGPLVEERTIAGGAVTSSTWIQKLSAFFSPRMIRYAAPALVLAVVVFAFFGWRQQRLNDFVALNTQAPAAGTAKTISDATSGTDRPDSVRGQPGDLATTRLQKEAKPQPTSVAAAPPPGKAPASESSDEKKAEGEASGRTTASKAGKEDAAPADKAEAAPPKYAQEPAPSPAQTQAQTAPTQEQQKDLARNNSIDDRDRGRDANVQRKGPARNDNEVATQRGGPAKNQAQPASKMKAGAPASVAGAREEDEAETRTVFGRHFRRVGSAWVDTAYSSSMSIRTLTRGTEDYRALVADEPAIGGIGKQLSGEVIVVWKGRAYRLN